MYQDLLSLGFSVFPVHGVTNNLQCTCGKPDCSNAGKHPYTAHGCKDASNDHQVVAKMFNHRTDLNVGIATGKPSGVFVLDMDAENALDGYVIPETMVVSTGRGKHYYFNMPQEFDVKNTTNLLPKVDIRGTGGYVIAPPSKHKSGAIYSFNGLLPCDAPDWLLDMLKPQKKESPKEYKYDDDKLDFKTINDMLSCISPDCSYDDWLHVGMALHSEGLPFSLWDNWSRCGSKYENGDCEKRWRGFGKSDGVSIGTLVYLAKQAGWLPVSKTPIDKPKKVIHKIEQKPPLHPPIRGLVGAIADWITETAIKPQPELSLAAALSFVSMLKGHRIKGATNLHPNLYIMSLAKTGTGKEHPFNCITWLSTALKMRNKLIGTPTSGSAIATGLKKANGCGLLPIDEFGRFLSGVTNRNAQSFQTEIVDFMIGIYSRSGSTYFGKQYADDKKNPQIVLENPYLSIIGCTVKSKLAEACNSGAVIDGFLNRWLIFETDNNPEEQWGANIGCVPADLIDLILEWTDKNPMVQDNIKVIPFERDAFDKFKEYKKAISRKQNAASHPIDALYSRLAGQVEKLCLILCDGDSINLEILNAAISIVEKSHLKTLEFADNISNTQHEADLMFVLDVIKRSKKLTKNHLTQQTRKLNQKTRSDILLQLVEAGEILIEAGANNTTFIKFVES